MRLLTRAVISIIRHAMASEHVRDEFWRAGRDMLAQRRFAPSDAFEMPPLPARVGEQSATHRKSATGRDAVFITARFRSGSTFLWNLFRSLPGVTAYYEPLNEKRWFLGKSGGMGVDSTHLGVDDYSKEYDGMEDLDRMFRDSWAFRELYMDQTCHDPDLYQYLLSLVERAKGQPVLQFNRVDFRLPWLRANFPRAKIIHLYRTPRETWMSILRKTTKQIAGKEDTVESYRDPFYTYEWANDLKRVFPFLDMSAAQHPYEIHYHLWRLSYSFGLHYADYSLGYEDLVNDFDTQIQRMFDVIGVEGTDMEALKKMNMGRITTRWHEYAEAAWFADIEEKCERVQRAFFSQDVKRKTV